MLEKVQLGGRAEKAVVGVIERWEGSSGGKSHRGRGVGRRQGKAGE